MMTSWRDQTALPVQEEIDELAGIALSRAVEHINARGSLAPFSLALITDRTVELRVSEYQADARAMIDTQLRDLLKDSNELLAAALVSDVRLKHSRREGQSAIQVFVEHRHGPALIVLLPYTAEGTFVQFDDPELADSPRQIWLQ